MPAESEPDGPRKAIRAARAKLASMNPARATRTSPESAQEIRTVSLVSLGCPKNLVDSEKMLGLLAADGLTPVSHDDAEGDDPADAVVINTCGFLEASRRESLEVIERALSDKAASRVKRVVVAGCLVQRHRARLLDWAPGIDAMIGVFDRDRIIAAVRGGRPGRDAPGPESPPYWISANALHAAKQRGVQTTGLTVNGKDGRGIGYFEDDSARLRLTPRHFAYLRLSEGCNQNCAFCTIPSIRGKMRSKPLDALTREARELVEDGAFELNLIGQDTTSYGDDLGIGFDPDRPGSTGMPAALRAVERAFDQSGVKDGWIRLMYAYPSNFSDGMIDAFAELAASGRLVPYIDIPLQHASDRVLAAMRRNVTAAQQSELIDKLRDRLPGMAIRTTFITGFPGETEADHEQLLEFVDRCGFDAVGVFEYSREAGTPAAAMDEDPDLHVPDEVKRRRRDELMRLQRTIAFEQAAYLAEQFDPERPASTGLRFDVLIDEPAADTTLKGEGNNNSSLYRGRAYFQAHSIDSVTYVHADNARSVGELVRCTVVGCDGYDLIARPCDELEKKVSLPLATG